MNRYNVRVTTREDNLLTKIVLGFLFTPLILMVVMAGLSTLA